METSIVRDLIRPYPRQMQFLEAADAHEYTLFGGAAGPGKSRTLRWWLIRLLHRWAKPIANGGLALRGVRVGLFCEDYPALRDRHLDRVRQEFPAWLGKLSETHKEFRLHDQYGAGVIAFRNLDDPSKYQSVEFAAIAVDELTRNPRRVFDELRARKRWPGIDFSPFGAATNPGGIGHGWVKKLWIDRDFSGDEDEALDPDDFAFVPARADDNPALPASYYRTLAALPPKLRRAYKDGDWDIFVGQFFTEWSREQHACEPFRIPPEWPRWRGIDYGYAVPFACLWLTRAPSGQVYVYREAYGAGLLASDQAYQIRLLSTGEAFRRTVGDPSMWAAQHNGEQMASVAARYAQADLPIEPANNDRRAGRERVREMLAWQAATTETLEDGRVLEVPGKPPRMQVFSSCVNLIRSLPALVHDKRNVEDVDSDGDDHCYDSLRYTLLSMDMQQPKIQHARFGDRR